MQPRKQPLRPGRGAVQYSKRTTSVWQAGTTTASALPLAELAAVGPEIAEVAVTCFSITLVGLAVGFVLLRVEAAVEGEE